MITFVAVWRGFLLRADSCFAQIAQPIPVAHDQRRHRLDRPRCLSEFLLDPVDLGKRAAKLFGEGSVPLQQVKALRSHALEDRLEKVKIANYPLPGGSEQPDSVLAAPSRFPVSQPKL